MAILHGENTGVGYYALLHGIFPTQGSNPCLLHFRQILYHLSHQVSPRKLEWVADPFSKGSSWPRNQTGVSCNAGRLFTSWATREALICYGCALFKSNALCSKTLPICQKSGQLIHTCFQLNKILVEISIFWLVALTYFWTEPDKLLRNKLAWTVHKSSSSLLSVSSQQRAMQTALSCCRTTNCHSVTLFSHQGSSSALDAHKPFLPHSPDSF